MVLSHYGLLPGLRKLGSQMSGPCPIHQGSNPKQFVVHLSSGNWHCFGDCSRGGGALELVSEIERVPVLRAAELVRDWFSISPQQQRQQRSRTMNAPSHRAYVVEDAEGDQNDQKGFWTRVGSAWPHKDGKGLNIQIAAGISVGGRIVLREYVEDDAKADEGKRKVAKK